eukprot:TRINITY_DN2604_c0_g1_i1.p1 TRINITY_DN2604_c0_g1~~TRINITY_DN2604_c0_g1_i1.p1  ORF type:complete len:397 (+),score=101.41 TRINITY_DN2604_c0_g1_i1:171-1193(+)
MSKLERDKLMRFIDRGMGILPARFVTQESNRLTIVYFGLSSLDVTNSLDHIADQRSAIIDFVYSLQVLPGPDNNYERCGFRGSPLIGNPWNPNCEPIEQLKHDYAHVANTYVALCILKMLGDDLSRVNRPAVMGGLRAIQAQDGSFRAMFCGSESDLRFVFCATAICSLLNDWSGFNKDLGFAYILKCRSWDNGFGQGPEQEAHGGSTYCALAALSLLGRIDELEGKDSLVRWLLERQISGFQGRVEKVADTCYSWWVGASLAMLGAWDLVNHDMCASFTYSCQHMIGGFSKVPGVSPDPLHTYFSLCALGMCGHDGFQPLHYSLGLTHRAAAAPTVFSS